MKSENILWSYFLYKGLPGIFWRKMAELFHQTGEAFTCVCGQYTTGKKKKKRTWWYRFLMKQSAFVQK